jgi:hypothetical protein
MKSAVAAGTIVAARHAGNASLSFVWLTKYLYSTEFLIVIVHGVTLQWLRLTHQIPDGAQFVHRFRRFL